MSYTLDIKYANGIVSAYMAGDSSHQNSYDILSKIMDECKAHNCFRILGVQSMTPLKVTAAYDLEKVFRELGIGKQYKVAWVEEDCDETREMLEYGAAVLRNRQLLNGGLFSTEAEALQWLLAD